MTDIQNYLPGLIENNPISIDASHITGLSSTSTITQATKTIATLSSGFVADYYTDGVADDVQLQQAIDAVNLLGGGRIFIRAGTYNISVSLIIRSNIIFEGEGESTKLVLAATVKLINQTGSTQILLSNVKFKNFKIDATGQADGAGSAAIQLYN